MNKYEEGTGVSGLGVGPSPVGLGMAGNYAILAEALISTTPGSEVTGDLGMYPFAATFVQGFLRATSRAGIRRLVFASEQYVLSE